VRRLWGAPQVLIQSFLRELPVSGQAALPVNTLTQLLRERFQNRLHVVAVVGRAEAGKTHWARKAVQAAASRGAGTATVSFATVTTHLEVLRQLAPLWGKQQGAILLNVSTYADLGMLSRLILELAIMGMVSDPSYGATLALPERARWTIYVEVSPRSPLGMHTK
jgi:hypothetical protein